MSREIIFREKTINGDWVFGNYTHIKKDFSTVKKGHYISNSSGSPFAYLVIPETVGQFIGLTDKNGTKIFEGDIIDGDIITNEFGDIVVKYGVQNVDAFEGVGYNLWDTYDSEDMGKAISLQNNMEVIGNIHDK